MKRIFFSIVLIAGLLSWRGAFALTPPYEESDMNREADLIVIGEIGTPVRCLGLIDKTECYDRYKYVVPLSIQQVVKGTAPKNRRLELYFYRYDYSKSKCTGDADALHFPGEAGTYYLKRYDDGTWHQVHWSGVKVTRQGHGPLPKCTQ